MEFQPFYAVCSVTETVTRCDTTSKGHCPPNTDNVGDSYTVQIDSMYGTECSSRHYTGTCNCQN